MFFCAFRVLFVLCAAVTAEDAAAMKTTTTMTTTMSARATSVVEIPGASHFVLEDRPREVRAVILDALLAAEGAIATP